MKDRELRRKLGLSANTLWEMDEDKVPITKKYLENQLYAFKVLAEKLGYSISFYDSISSNLNRRLIGGRVGASVDTTDVETLYELKKDFQRLLDYLELEMVTKSGKEIVKKKKSKK